MTFVSEIMLTAKNRSSVQLLERSIDVFAKIEKIADDIDGLRRIEIGRFFTPSEIRTYARVFKFLRASELVAWNQKEQREINEYRRCRAIIDEAANIGARDALEKYDRYLVETSKKRLAASSHRNYLRAACELMKMAADTGRAIPSQSDVDTYLRKRPGQYANLARYCRFFGLNLPTRSTSKGSGLKKRDLVLEISVLLEIVGDSRQKKTVRLACAAGAISRLFGYPLSFVIEAYVEHKTEPGVLELRIGNEDLVLDGQYLQLFGDIFSARYIVGSHLFVANDLTRPMAIETARQHIKGALLAATRKPHAND